MTLTPTSTLVLIINNLHLHPSYYKTPCFIHFSSPSCLFLFVCPSVLDMWIRRGRGRPPLNLSPVRSSPSSLDQQVVSVPKEMVSSISFEEEKEPACLLHSPSQMETLEEGNGEKVINRKRSIMETCNHRDMYSPSAGACDLLALSLSASSQVLFDEEVDKPIPFKKRITSYTKAEEEQIVNEQGKEERKGKAKARLTTLMSIENEEEEEEEEAEAAKKKTKKTMKMMMKKKRVGKKQKGLLLMEGSRCSRVNGRGWRCNQKTLVGYALCQHHLGMARIRSVNTFSGGTRDARIGGEDNGPRRQNLKEKGKGDIRKEMEICEEV